MENSAAIAPKTTFAFDLNAKITRMSDHDLLVALENYAKIIGYRYFATKEFDNWHGRPCHSNTITERFGSWKRSLSIIGIAGGRKREYSVDELISNLEEIWREIGRPPGHRQISKLGAKISSSPYARIWGSVRKACEALSLFHKGSITRAQLLAGNPELPQRRTIPLDIRWAVLKRDSYRCTVCGASPALNHAIQLQIDHIIPISKGGTNELANLRTACNQCNIGKSDDYNC